MNNSLDGLVITLDGANGGGGWSISQTTISQVVLVVVGINSVGVVANGLLVAGLVLLRGSGRMSRASVQMLLQQAAVDFLTCAVAIAFSFDSLNWPPAGTTPDWLRAVVCYGWHSQGEFFTLYPLSVYNNVLLAGERLVAIALPFRAVQLGQIRYRLALLFGWLGFCVGYNWPQFTFATYDPVKGCVSIDFSNPAFAAQRWYFFAWTLITYPIPLFFAITFNAMAVLQLRSESYHLTATEKTSSVFGNIGATTGSMSTRTDSLLKRRAAFGLQRAAVALAAIFAFTSFPLQAVTAIQCVTGNYWGVDDIRNVIGIGISALHFTADPIVCFVFVPGIRRALISFCPQVPSHRPLRPYRTNSQSTARTL